MKPARPGRPKGSKSRGEKTVNVNVTLTPTEIDYVRMMGQGFVSHGVIELIKFHQAESEKKGAK